MITEDKVDKILPLGPMGQTRQPSEYLQGITSIVGGRCQFAANPSNTITLLNSQEKNVGVIRFDGYQVTSIHITNVWLALPTPAFDLAQIEQQGWLIDFFRWILPLRADEAFVLAKELSAALAPPFKKGGGRVTERYSWCVDGCSPGGELELTLTLYNVSQLELVAQYKQDS